MQYPRAVGERTAADITLKTETKLRGEKTAEVFLIELQSKWGKFYISHSHFQYRKHLEDDSLIKKEQGMNIASRPEPKLPPLTISIV